MFCMIFSLFILRVKSIVISINEIKKSMIMYRIQTHYFMPFIGIYFIAQVVLIGG